MPRWDGIGRLEGIRISFIGDLFELSRPNGIPVVSENFQATIQRAVQDRVINVNPSLWFVEG
jgi:hypothetical protein